jgi:hypothetical protein
MASRLNSRIGDVHSRHLCLTTRTRAGRHGKAGLKNPKVARERAVVALQVFGETGTGGINSHGLTRRHLIEGVAASLRRLLAHNIDPYQMHGVDPATSVEHGHVRHTGISHWAARQIMKALGIGERHACRVCRRSRCTTPWPDATWSAGASPHCGAKP